MKLCKLVVVLGLACAATAASAQFVVTVASNQPIIIGQLVPPQAPLGFNPRGRAVLRTSMQTPMTLATAVKKPRQPDVMISNQNYKLDCYEKTPGVCERIADLLEQYGGR